MAYASVASLLETIDHVNYHGDSSISSRFKDQITSLHQHTSFLQSFLDEAPKRADNWEETIRDVTDRAEEIIDILVSDSLLKSSTGSELSFSLDELEKVTEEMETTVDRLKGRSSKDKAEPDKELMKIVSLLCEGSSNLETISIVGTSGMGKSTLASNAYDHPLVNEHFDVFAWSTVGQERRSIALELLRFINFEIFLNTGDEAAVESLYTSLTDRRYLIVLQDVWGVDSWDGVRLAFPDNGNGSRIIMTTRSLDLASSIGHVHEMSLLDEDESWNMLREKIFEGDPCPSRLESIGKTIARSCEGHQLPLQVISGILADYQTEAVWEDISEYMNSNSDDYVISRVTFLCYMYLPHNLRDCFLYLGCFPGDQEIRVSKLIKLWVAEGFLNQSEAKSFEETGEEHVEILVRRSLVSVCRWKSNGRIKSITFHVLLRQTCFDYARTCNFISFGALSSAEPPRRVSSSYYSDEFRQGAYDSAIRTLILRSTYHGDTCFERSIGDVRLLRILDLSGAPHYDLPEEVFELFHLRYLAFHSGFSISEAISNLQNLQTLIVCLRGKGSTFCNLPGESIRRMPQLRHILNFSFQLPTPKQGEGEIFALENLEMLSTVVDFVCSRENLKMIPNVKKLNVAYNKIFKDAVEDIELQNLISLHRLEILKIEMQCSFSMEKHNKMSVAFPPTLKKLNLMGLQLPWEDMKIVGSLPNLQVLKLRTHSCIGDTWETSEGGFSRLTYLMIVDSDLEHWITGSSHFPMLRTLQLCLCLQLSKVPREIGEIPTLEVMEFYGNNQSLLNSAKRIQEDRQSLGDDSLEVVVLQ